MELGDYSLLAGASHSKASGVSLCGEAQVLGSIANFSHRVWHGYGSQLLWTWRDNSTSLGYCIRYTERQWLCSISGTETKAWMIVIYCDCISSKPNPSHLAFSLSRIIFHPLSESFFAPRRKWTWVHDMAAFVCDCEWRRFWVHEHQCGR